MRVITEKYHRDFIIDQGYGFRTVRWSAWRESRPNIKGYGITKQEAIDDLTRNVQPLLPKGLLWFDDSDRTVRQKAAQAIRRFRRKFPGIRPAVVYVNPADFKALGASPREATGVEIKLQRETLRYHFLVMGENQA